MRIILTLAMVCTFLGANAQLPMYKQTYKQLKEFHGNVSQYLMYNFIDVKENFKGKDLLNLIGKLEPKFVEYLPSSSHTPVGIKGISFFFESDSAKTNTSDKRPILRITFENLLVPMDSVFKFWKKNKKQWTNEERVFYGRGIIKSIVLQGGQANGEEEPPPIDGESKLY